MGCPASAVWSSIDDQTVLATATPLEQLICSHMLLVYDALFGSLVHQSVAGRIMHCSSRWSGRVTCSLDRSRAVQYDDHRLSHSAPIVLENFTSL